MPLVISDAPEILDDTVTQGDGRTLYVDRSGRLTGARILVFHQNQSAGSVRLGIQVRAVSASGTLQIAGRSQALVDRNGTRAGHMVASRYFDAFEVPARTLPLAAGRVATVGVWDVPPQETLVAWYEVTLLGDDGSPQPLDVQTFVTARRGLDADAAWDLPLAPWQTARNRSSKIRATVPHSAATVRIQIPRLADADAGYFADLSAMSPSGGPDASPGQPPFPPAGFPLRGTPGPWLSPALPLARTHGTWPYQADPAGFDGTHPAGEYVAGWNWADRAAEGDPDPAAPAFWYRSRTHDGVWMRQWNYGEYGCLIRWEIASDDGRPLRIAVTPARERFSSPWAWRRTASGDPRGRPPESDRVPWEVIQGGQLYTRADRNEATAYVVADRTPAEVLWTTVTAGAYAPFRLLIETADR